MKKIETSNSYPFIRNSILLGALIIPALGGLSLLSELSLVKTERDLQSRILHERKTGTLRRIKSAVDSIEFLGFALAKQSSKLLREELIRDFLYSQHYFEAITLADADNTISISSKRNAETGDSYTFPLHFHQDTVKPEKHKDSDYYSFRLIEIIENKPEHRSKLLIMKTIPGQPLRLLAGVIDSHDLLYPTNNTHQAYEPNAQFESFACIKAPEQSTGTMVYSEFNEAKKEMAACGTEVERMNTTVPLAALLGGNLTTVVDLDTSEAASIDLLGNTSRPHKLERMSIRLINNIKSQDLNSFIIERIGFSEIGLLLVGVALFWTGHYGLKKSKEKEEYKNKLKVFASTDSLTGVYNRRAITSLLEEKIRQKEPDQHFLLFLDIDHFKEVNDSLGHDTGDKVICNVCKIITCCVRRSDSIGRIGGDEILILLDGVGGEDNALKVANNIVKRCSEPFHSSNLSLSVTVSIGVATCRSCKTPREWIQCADLALYKAKEAGGNCAMTNK